MHRTDRKRRAGACRKGWCIGLVITALPLLSCSPDDGTPDLLDVSGAPISVIGDDARCPDCALSFRTVAVLGSDSAPASVREDAAGRECMVARLSSGHFVLSGAIGGGQLLLYDDDGAFLRTMGRSGEGPGEFGRDLRLTVDGFDTLYVMDDSQNRMQVLTSDGDLVRSFPTPAQYRNFARLNDGTVLFHRLPTTPTDPLFIQTGAEGTVLDRFGEVTLTEVDLETWTMSPSGDHGFWTASLWEYVLYQWAAPDSVAHIVRREADWFPPPTDGPLYPDGVFETVPPPPFLDHIWEGDPGMIWTYARIPHPQWEPGISLRPMHEWYERSFLTMVEVIDVENARLVAQGSYEGKLGRVCNSPLVYSVVESAGGDTRVRVLEPVLTGPAGTSGS